MGGLRELEPQPGYDSGDDFLNQFLVPALQRAHRYNRSVGYFRSSALAVAARGLSHFIASGGQMRLVVGTDLTEEDCSAMSGGLLVPDSLAERLANDLVPADEIEQHRLEVLAWLASVGRLMVKVVLPLDSDGQPVPGGGLSPYFHEKIGVLRDREGEGIAFQGSVNETSRGWGQNFESFSVYTSWDRDPRHYDFWVERFENRWTDRVAGWKVLELPAVLRDRLLTFAPTSAPPSRDPEEPPDYGDPARVARFLLAAPTLASGDGLAEATSGVTLFPHQRQVAERLAGEYPRSWLVADEVGLGKTISAGVALRRLLLSGDVKRALILAPASVCRQWQDELFEKFGLWVDRYDNGAWWGALPGDEDRLRTGDNPFAGRDVLIVSSHLARRQQQQDQLLAAGPWDLVIVDEAHHARRQGTADPTRRKPGQLMRLLDRMSEQESAKAVWLLTATPMQVDPIELLDLLHYVGLSGTLADWPNFERWYRELSEPRDDAVAWNWLADMIRRSPTPPPGRTETAVLDEVSRKAGPVVRALVERFGSSADDADAIVGQLGEGGRTELRRWLNTRGPVGQFVTRHSRTTLKEYRDQGLLREPVADRNVVPVLIDFSTAEQRLYRELDELIDRLLAVSQRRKGAGFFLTVYRRRLTSSWAAIRRTLEKRLAREQSDLDDELLDEAERTGGTEVDELASLPLTDEDVAEIQRFIAEINLVNDSKFDRLRQDLDQARGSGQAAIVFTQFTDTLDSLRDRLKGIYGPQLATFTGDGGRIQVGNGEWERVSKQELVDAVTSRRVTVLLANDAASEGLNLQACSWLINYDMPWNPMRAEQRIGRIDRIGQQASTIQIRNYFIPDTVEERVYELLSDRIDDFSDLLGNLQPILGHVENAVRAVWEAPRAERAKAADDALEQIDHRIEELREHGIDLTLEDPMPVPSNPEPPVTLDQLRMLVRDHLGIEVGLPDAPASFDPKQVSRDRGSWCALATYGHPRLEGLLRQRAEESREEDVLTLGRADVESITRTAVVRADRVPPQAVRRVDALATLGAKASDADAGREADALARDAALARLEHIREVVLRRAVRREESIRQRFVRLVRRTIVSECALSHHEHGTVADPLAIWLSFGQDQTAWRYADTFRNRLDVGFDQLLPSHPADLTAMSVGQARAGHRDRTADELNQLMVEWREFESSLT